MHQMSQKILSASEKYACLQRLNRRRESKRKGSFQEELLDFKGEQMFLQQEQEKRSNDLIQSFLPLSKK